MAYLSLPLAIARYFRIVRAMQERTWADVGEIIRRIRVDHGMSVKDAVARAKQFGAKASVANWRIFERGEREDYRDLTIAGIAKGVGLTTDMIYRLKAGEDPTLIRLESTDWTPSDLYDPERRASVGEDEWAYITSHPEQMAALEGAAIYGMRYLSVKGRQRVLEFIAELNEAEQKALHENRMDRAGIGPKPRQRKPKGQSEASRDAG